jgi:hypothetical protein
VVVQKPVHAGFRQQSGEEYAPKFAIVAPYRNALVLLLVRSIYLDRIEEKQATGVDTLITDSFPSQPNCINSEYRWSEQEVIALTWLDNQKKPMVKAN